MNTPCLVCGRLVPVGSGGRCSQHRPQQRQMRSTARWTKLSRKVRAIGYCEVCGRPAPPSELECDHIVPASQRPDLVYYEPNLRAICKDCHRQRA